MNRLSFLFAVFVAAGFAVQGTPPGKSSGDSPPPAVRPGTAHHASGHIKQEPALIEDAKSFISRVLPQTGKPRSVKILFATMPDPIESHLAAAFDHNVAALQDGLQDSQFLFDSSWIPWKAAPAFETFEDQLEAEAAEVQQHSYPGMLFFRSNQSSSQANSSYFDPYENGVLIFLLTEKPTAGISLQQVENALQILKASRVTLSDHTLKIVGPSFSGSFPSLVKVVKKLEYGLGVKSHKGDILIRSGGVTGDDIATRTIQAIANNYPGNVHFGSVAYPYRESIMPVTKFLAGLGIEPSHVALLSEDESFYGHTGRASSQDEQPCPSCWRLSFPRDISELRSTYEKQGVLDGEPTAYPWKRYLHLEAHSEEQQGDSVRLFGGSSTVAAQESVLFGISEFLKTHDIHAVIIVATNEADRYFLAQFLHAHNGGTRVVVISSTRLFMRGSTAQFRGDMMVSDFPLLPRLADWTLGQENKRDALQPNPRLFADDLSEGVYVATVGMFSHSQPIVPGYLWLSWQKGVAVKQHPKMYISALGSGAAWPIRDLESSRLDASGPDCKQNRKTNWRVTMPFDLNGNPWSADRSISLSHFWQILFWILIAVAITYCLLIWYSSPITRRRFAYLQPVKTVRYWILLIAIPAFVLGVSFRCLAWTIAIPHPYSHTIMTSWYWANAMIFVAPLAVAACGVGKAIRSQVLSLNSPAFFYEWWPTVLAIIPLPILWGCTRGYGDWSQEKDVGAILNLYREMHWESGLSLLPTWLLMLLALFLWSYHAGVGSNVLSQRSILPDIPKNERVSDLRAKDACKAGLPFPLVSGAGWYWGACVVVLAFTISLCWLLRVFRDVTSLESQVITHRTLLMVFVIQVLMLLDVVQFFWLWGKLKGLLDALERLEFKRSFVPLREFNWGSIWTFSAGSFQERRLILMAQIECVLELVHLCKWRMSCVATNVHLLEKFKEDYNKINLESISVTDYWRRLGLVHKALACLGGEIASVWEKERQSLSGCWDKPSVSDRKPERGNDRFGLEELEVAELPTKMRLMECFLCLQYVSFIQMMLVRVRSLGISITTLFSLSALAVAIYPFVPMQPFFLGGVCLFLVVASAFFVVFSEMDKNPILARIVNGDPRKLEWSFYEKFGEALILPLLTLLSSVLPGGAGRLIDVLKALLNHTA